MTRNLPNMMAIAEVYCGLVVKTVMKVWSEIHIQLNRRIWTKATRGWSAPVVRHFFRQQCWLDGEVDDGNSIMMKKQPAWCWFVTFFYTRVSTFFLPDNIIDISVIIQCWRLIHIGKNNTRFQFWMFSILEQLLHKVSFSEQANRVTKTPSARQQCWPESFCKSGKFCDNFNISWRIPRYFAIRNIQIICKVFR